MAVENDSEVRKAASYLELSEDERAEMIDEKRQIWLTDQYNREMHQYTKGFAKGFKEGFVEEFAKGREDLEKVQKEIEALRREIEALRAKNG